MNGLSSAVVLKLLMNFGQLFKLYGALLVVYIVTGCTAGGEEPVSDDLWVE